MLELVNLLICSIYFIFYLIIIITVCIIIVVVNIGRHVN